MSVNNLLKTSSDEVPSWSNLFVNSIRTKEPIFSYDEWASYTPTAVNNIVSVSDLGTEYHKVGNIVHLNINVAVEVESSDTPFDTIILGNLPYQFKQSSDVPVLGSYISSSPFYIMEASDNLYGFGRFQINSLLPASDLVSPFNLTVNFNNFENNKIYIINNTFSYGN